MNEQYPLKRFIQRYQEGKCSKEELEQFRVWLGKPENRQLLEETYDTLSKGPLEDLLSSRKAAIYRQVMHDERIRTHLQPAIHEPARTIGWRNGWVAAIAALLVMVPLLYYNLSFFKTSEPTVSEPIEKYAIVPGSDRARIILNDGTEVNLEEIAGDTVIIQDGFSIVKDENGAIFYQYDKSKALTKSKIHNTVVTPKGGQYQVVLPDGTHVWLNAASKLKYPVYFDADKREVILEGEGYFEVAKQTIDGKRVPFIVLSGSQQLEVLGTAFNIQAYGQDVTTTLVEGKVRLGMEHTNKDVLLQANEEALLRSGTSKFDVREVDPMYATAWKDGNFSFRKASITEVMESVARWYDIDVVYEATGKNSSFSGTISRFEQFDKLLEFIELTGSVHFTIEGRRVTVKE